MSCRFQAADADRPVALPILTSPALYGHVFKTFARDIEPPQALSIKYSVKPQ